MKKTVQLSQNIARPNDLVFTQRGTLGQVSIVPNHGHDRYVVSQSQMKITVDPSKADVNFLYYLFNSPDQLRYIRNSAIQTGVPHTNLGILKKTPVKMPPLAIQKQVASVLTALDDRIALLRETNTTLEAIAQALFKSWFVDFDPVRAKQQGREPEGMDPTAAALFPDSFEESELGLVPKGWSRLAFTDTVKVIGGGTPKTSIPEYWGGDIPWFSVVDAPATTDVFVIDTAKHISVQGLNNSSTKLLAEGTTIISARGTVGRLALVGREMAMNQSCYGLRGKADDAYFTYFSTYRLVESLKQRSHGSVFDTITTDTMRGVFVIYPDKNVIQAFETVLSPVMNRIKTNLEQTQTLATLRDTMLPRLISGQLRMPEAETALEAA
ncbi:restriction endonuclease subunit S [Undibacterium arcticum]|uniref:restriction endonuclease subunit S n=1 Tax=Undibacterium arcticum TaxID=1762892 RepID=UPI00360D18F7